jgi:ABC transport system ATP-binding/permease protein
MSEKILLLLMELFAIAGRGSAEDEMARRKMEEEFLGLTLSIEKAKEYLTFYDTCVQKYHRDELGKEDGDALRTSQALDICSDLIGVLSQKQKIVVIVRLIEYVHVAKTRSDQELTFLRIVYKALKIDSEEYEQIFHLVATISIYLVLVSDNEIMKRNYFKIRSIFHLDPTGFEQEEVCDLHNFRPE